MGAEVRKNKNKTNKILYKSHKETNRRNYTNSISSYSNSTINTSKCNNKCNI